MSPLIFFIFYFMANLQNPWCKRPGKQESTVDLDQNAKPISNPSEAQTTIATTMALMVYCAPLNTRGATRVIMGYEGFLV